MEFQNIFVFHGVSSLHHQAMVLVGSPEKPGILQIFCEVAMHMCRSVLYGRAAPQKVGHIQVGFLPRSLE
jgi:hypothetical protein